MTAKVIEEKKVIEEDSKEGESKFPKRTFKKHVTIRDLIKNKLEVLDMIKIPENMKDVEEQFNLNWTFLVKFCNAKLESGPRFTLDTTLEELSDAFKTVFSDDKAFL